MPVIGGLSSALALLSQPAFAQGPNPLLPHNLSPWGMFLNADIVVKAVMIGLAFASLVTWTVWLAKTLELRGAKRLARRRLEMLESGGNLLEAVRACKKDRDAVAQLILSTAREAELSGGMIDEGFKERVALRLERVEAATTRQVSRGVGILATIGATAPFVGLFGTVWGIIDAFQALNLAGGASLRAVGPGIAEALVATAGGLGAAIPAAIFYNYFGHVIREQGARMDEFSLEFMNLTERTYEE